MIELSAKVEKGRSYISVSEASNANSLVFNRTMSPPLSLSTAYNYYSTNVRLDIRVCAAAAVHHTKHRAFFFSSSQKNKIRTEKKGRPPQIRAPDTV